MPNLVSQAEATAAHGLRQEAHLNQAVRISAIVTTPTEMSDGVPASEDMAESARFLPSVARDSLLLPRQHLAQDMLAVTDSLSPG